MTQLRELANGEEPEPKKESFKAWKEGECPTKIVGGDGYQRKFRKGTTSKVLLTDDEVKRLNDMHERAKERVDAHKAQKEEVRRMLDLPENAPIPRSLVDGGSKFNRDAMIRFCVEYQNHNLITKAAKVVPEVSVSAIRHHMKNNPMFQAMVEEAKIVYRDKIVQTVYQRAVEGIDEPIIGGMARDQIVAYKKVYSDRLLELEAKRVEHGYRDKGGVEINTGGGVLVVQAGNMDQQSWEEKYGAMTQESPE
jgi:hypothetical protein